MTPTKPAQTGSTVSTFGYLMPPPPDGLAEAGMGAELGSDLASRAAHVERALLEALGLELPFWTWDRATGRSTTSPRLREILGLSRNLEDRESLLERVHPKDLERLTRAIDGLLLAGSTPGFEIRVRAADSAYLRVHCRVRAIEDDPGLMTLVVIEADEGQPTANDELIQIREELESRIGDLAEANVKLMAVIEGKVRTERLLEDSRTLYHSLVESVPFTIFRKDLQGRYTFGNRLYCELHGLDLPGLVGKTDYDLYPAELARKYREDDRRVCEQGEVLDIEEDHQRPDEPGVRQVVHTVKCPIYDGSGRLIGIQGMFADVTERRKASEMLAYQATHDSLTGLPNRELFRGRLEALLPLSKGDSTRVALLLVDLDRFKEINDTFGHHFGDRVLRRLSPRFEAILKPNDFVARLGGDEYGLLLPGANRESAVRVADQLLARLSEPLTIDGHVLDIGASIGVALYPDHGTDSIGLMKCADVAMYAAKRSRCGYAFYSAEQSSSSPRRMAMISELRRAPSLGQLRLHYQPKVELATGRAVGAEALIRWLHPRDGLISPSQFIPLAEQTGLVRGIDLWAVSKALEECRTWPDLSDPPLQVSVNLAAIDLHDLDLVDQFGRMLGVAGVEPGRLVVEVTESAMMANPSLAREVLEGIHDMGVHIAIDDFGTGYSSLAYLKDLPIDEVKIDQSFVRDMAERTQNACIVRAVVDLGHNLGLKVTAEGAEDARTLEMLAQLGCDLVQGYHISRPLPLDEFQAWLQDRGRPGLERQVFPGP